MNRQYGASTTIIFELYDYDDGKDLRTDAAHASGDTTIIKDEGVEANTTNGFVSEGNGKYSIQLTATEMQAARIALSIVDQGTKAWLDKVIIIETFGDSSAQFPDNFDGIADAVFEEALSGHTTAGSFGELLDILRDRIRYVAGTAQGAGSGANTLQLAAGQVSADDEFNNCVVMIIGGTGTGERRIIADTVDSSNEISVTGGNWTVDSTSIYVIFGN